MGARFVQVGIGCSLSRDRAEAALSLVSELRVDPGPPLPAVLAAQVLLDGFPVATVEDELTLRAGEASVVQSAVLHRVELWQPRVLGVPRRYEARTVLVVRTGEVADRRALRFGVRELELEPPRNAGDPPSVRVNGRTAPWTGIVLPEGGDLPAPVIRSVGDAGLLWVLADAGTTVERLAEDCSAEGLLLAIRLPPGAKPEEVEQLAARLSCQPSLGCWVPAAGERDWLSEPLAYADPGRPVADNALAAAFPVGLSATNADLWVSFRPEPDPQVFRGEVILHNAGPGRSLLNVVAAVTDRAGVEVYQENLAGEAPAAASEPVGDLYWRFPPGFAGPYLLRLEVIDEEGASLATLVVPRRRSPEPDA